jgi:hypothetical protein
MQVVIRAVTVAAVLALALVFALPADAAAPNYILISGPRLEHPVLLADWNENLDLMSALIGAPRAKGRAIQGLRRRPSFDLAEFWAWTLQTPPTQPSEATQHGRLFPAHGRKPAVIRLMVNGHSFPRLLPRSVREILARHRVPLRL